MVHIAHATLDFQRLAARRRPRHAVVALRLARIGAPALLAGLAMAGGGGGVAMLAMLAMLLALLASAANLARLAWALLGPHVAILARRAAAAAAAAAARAGARALALRVDSLSVKTRLVL